MTIESDVFKRYSPDLKKLSAYGFKKEKNGYSLKKSFMNDDFYAEIFLSEEDGVTGEVYDSETKDKFLPLRVEGQSEGFGSEVRAGYIQLLSEIREHCFTVNYFVSPQANRIADLIYKAYSDEPVFMWEKYPTFGVYKNPDNDKWYALVMNLERSRLGSKSQEFTDVINLKLDKDEIPELLKSEGYYPAYHMNKKYWITLTLDETVKDSDIMRLIEESHSYTLSKSKKRSK